MTSDEHRSEGQAPVEPREERLRLRSDADHWSFDLAVQQTGQVQHFWDPRRLPASVTTHDMISKQLGKGAQRLERLARSEAAAGHGLTALDFYFEAAGGYAQAQHAIFVNNPEKRMLHQSSLRCYDEVRKLAPVVIEKVVIPWQGKSVTGYLHLAPVENPAPLVFFITGIDMTKEMVPDPLRNWATARGMHLFVFEGPGQGECNLDDLYLTVDNYEQAASAAISHLIARPEVDPRGVALYAMSFGSYWGARLAGIDDRLAAVVLQWASVSDMHYLFQGFASPRYKQVLAYVTRAKSEEELDEFIAEMKAAPFAPAIGAPTLITVGEFDQRNPMEEIYRFFDSMTSPRELWVFADQHHRLSVKGTAGASTTAVDTHLLGMDWIRDRLDGRPLTGSGEVRYLEGNGIGPNDPAASVKRHWFE